jgi:hypothetical protein
MLGAHNRQGWESREVTIQGDQLRAMLKCYCREHHVGYQGSASVASLGLLLNKAKVTGSGFAIEVPWLGTELSR